MTSAADLVPCPSADHSLLFRCPPCPCSASCWCSGCSTSPRCVCKSRRFEQLRWLGRRCPVRQCILLVFKLQYFTQVHAGWCSVVSLASCCLHTRTSALASLLGGAFKGHALPTCFHKAHLPFPPPDHSTGQLKLGVLFWHWCAVLPECALRLPTCIKLA